MVDFEEMIPDLGEDMDDLDIESIDDDPEGETEPEPAKPAQSIEERAANARIRREAEKEAQKILDAKIASKGWVNPYTGAKILTEADYSAYEKQNTLNERAKNEGVDPKTLEDREYIAQKRAEEEAQKEAQKRTNQDLKDFAASKPDVDMEKLLKNEKFMKFGKGKLGFMPLTEIYDDFVDFVGDTSKMALQKQNSKSDRSTSSSGSGAASTLTPAQKQKLEAWNKSNPSMKMSVDEFLKK
ncbi:MAG: hypothetical protein WCP73_09800 [Eubacteriales bacterium]